MAGPVEEEIGVVTVEYNVTNGVHGQSPGYNSAMLNRFRVASPHIQYNVTNCAARPGNYTARRIYRAYRAAPYAYRAAPAGNNNINRDALPVNYNAAPSRTVNYNAAPARSNNANRVAPPAYYNNAAPVGGNNVNHAVLPAFHNAATRTENNNTAPTENNNTAPTENNNSNRTVLPAYYHATPGGYNNANHVVPPAYYNAAPVENNNAAPEGKNSTDAAGGQSRQRPAGGQAPSRASMPPPFASGSDRHGSQQQQPSAPRPSGAGVPAPSTTSHQPSAFGYAPPSNGGYYYRPHVEYNNVKCNCSQCHP